MSNEPGVVADCGRSPNCILNTTPNRTGFVEPPSNHDSSHHHPGLSSQNYGASAWSSSTTAQPTLSLAPIGFDRQMPMMPYFGEATMGPLGGPLTATPLRTQQQQHYMPLNSDVNMRSHNPGGISHPTLLPNGPTETPAGARNVPQHSRQPVTDPVRSESGNPPSHDDRSCSLPAGNFLHLAVYADFDAATARSHSISDAHGLAVLTEDRSPAKGTLNVTESSALIMEEGELCGRQFHSRTNRDCGTVMWGSGSTENSTIGTALLPGHSSH
ncbi:hypothetical protein P168DRAFT_338316 [Aspergillus campestris IBT 28561]|uniref:Uncharacterized protein n=1 Tax=Aspergillus campestris (strain IBT 28561) TaxID=1392248 RepID=A0A2I1DBU8_ASPC2|nr:uncharacterized protein P168DRAFT_338316 [Aspergillus campestris IBT 28561]PKY07340.1 hypothetical protein P168DRAFT_338316 [Aspergillus campestris IBT 28561]